MKLSEFISETLKEIIDGVADAQDHAKAKGAIVSPAQRKMGGNTAAKGTSQKVEFDIALASESSSGGKSCVGVFLSVGGGGAQKENSEAVSSTSRVKFTVPMRLPAQP